MLVPDVDLMPSPYYPHSSGYAYTSGEYARDINLYYNFTRCRDLETFPIYIYSFNDWDYKPDDFFYPKVLRDSPLFNRTTDAHEACVLVPNVETSCPHNWCRQTYEETAMMLRSLDYWDWGEYTIISPLLLVHVLPSYFSFCPLCVVVRSQAAIICCSV